jgi:hypothetical protein
MFENDFFELRLLEIDNTSRNVKFNLVLLNKFTSGNIGFQISSDVINIEFNKYYYGRISTTNNTATNGTTVTGKKVCLTIVELERNPRDNIYYKANNSFELSEIKNFNVASFKSEYRNPLYDGILKCKNTCIGKTIDDLSTSEETLTNTISTLEMDFTFVKVGGSEEISISDMPLPPTTTQPASTENTESEPTEPVDTSVPPQYNTSEQEYSRDIEAIFNFLNEYKTYDTTESDNTTSSQAFTDVSLDKFKTVEKYNNTLPRRDNFNNYLFKSRDGFMNYTEGFTNSNIINLSELREFLTNRAVEYYRTLLANKDNIEGMIAFFHYQYIKEIKEQVDILINNEIQNGRCNSSASEPSPDASNHCLISNYFLDNTFNDTIKNILEGYVNIVFNPSFDTDGDSNTDLVNPLIKQLILNDATYGTQPFGINEEINNFINDLNENFGLNVNFTVNIKFIEIPSS